MPPPSDPATRQRDAVAIGRKIRAQRIKRGWAQRELAAALGVPESRVSGWEKASRRLDAVDLLGIADTLSCEVTALLPEKK